MKTIMGEVLLDHLRDLVVHLRGGDILRGQHRAITGDRLCQAVHRAAAVQDHPQHGRAPGPSVGQVPDRRPARPVTVVDGDPVIVQQLADGDEAPVEDGEGEGRVALPVEEVHLHPRVLQQSYNKRREGVPGPAVPAHRRRAQVQEGPPVADPGVRPVHVKTVPVLLDEFQRLRYSPQQREAVQLFLHAVMRPQAPPQPHIRPRGP